MLKRIITATVSLAVLIPLLVFGGEYAATAVFAVLCAVSVYELASCCGLKPHVFITAASVILFTFLSLLPFLSKIALNSCENPAENFALRIMNLSFSLAVVPTVIMFVILVIGYKKLDAEKLLMFISVATYASVGFGSLIYLVYSQGLWAVWFVCAVSWGTDTFAYFTGMAFGRKKLCPDISPKKTVAGAIGGTVLGTVIGVIIAWIFTGNPLLGLFALPLSVISQFGDLAASVIKRRFGVKDYGKLFPGHGGVMDRFDSVIAVSVFASVILSVLG